ncbi:uncharacterized protein LOC113331049 [Papaver somniferum]|uniref:uncharacterized protein LOC113331049 n=1 Tax=Papaver somniferum TaxID=3469 RepID=UPI000E6F97EA|nr:uncharacterized protein LOC113331049 [Papaver somniferum]
MGDFNCVLRIEEKKGGVVPRTSSMNDFSDWLDDSGLFEEDVLGCTFTWHNRQYGPTRIISKLDRAIINNELLHQFENWRCKALLREVAMKLWNQHVFGNVNSRLKQDQVTYEAAMRLSDDDPTNEVKLNRMKDVGPMLQNTRMKVATMLKQKARNNWLTDGATNPSFFHNSIRIRRSNNTISELVGDNGETITDYEQLKTHIMGFYEDKFNGDDSVLEEQIFDVGHEVISQEESQTIDSIPSYEEIKTTEKFILNGINSSMLVLFPKVRGANSLKDFCPIGLSNFFFKIFTKILATRLGEVLGRIVYEEQVAFMKGMSIHKNIILASKMINELHIKRKFGYVCLKLDITRAFDTVSWNFILEVFRRYSFSKNWCSWIWKIPISARISVLVNGSQEGYFTINRGLSQGDSLSPLVFVLIEDIFSRNITKLFKEGNMKSLRNLVDLLGSYHRVSGQTLSRLKSKVYYGGGSSNRRRTIADFLGMSIATFSG